MKMTLRRSLRSLRPAGIGSGDSRRNRREESLAVTESDIPASVDEQSARPVAVRRGQQSI
jgi:hypothetical protein